MTSPTELEDDLWDRNADDEIRSCLTARKPRSFFLHAGAGSGKTRSLITALKHLRSEHGPGLWLRGQRIRVITYTNAATDEIRRRIEFDPLIDVSTIHSFLWSLVQGFDTDIRAWAIAKAEKDIVKLGEKISNPRTQKKTLPTHQRKLVRTRERLRDLPDIDVFYYSPSGDNGKSDSLNHSEIIDIAVYLLENKQTLRVLLVTRFPVLMIDECQDTNKSLMQALFKVEAEHRSKFSLGLFGDTMQRIYNDGLQDLKNSIPTHWDQPVKDMNHRCPRRIVELLNKMRSDGDSHVQRARKDAEEGELRVFLVETPVKRSRSQIEEDIALKMASLTEDTAWMEHQTEVKTLILEHKMAAKRMGFAEFYESLHKIDRYRTGLLEGSLPLLSLFTDQVLPLIRAAQSGDNFAVAEIARRHSPLLDPSTEAWRSAGGEAQLQATRGAVDQLVNLFDDTNSPSFLDVAECIKTSGLFSMPEELRDVPADSFRGAEPGAANTIEVRDEKDEQSNLVNALQTPFNQIAGYVSYLEQSSPFSTQQGVKGLEFPRVLVVLDDEEAGGFLFSYEKLFGADPPSKTDLRNIANQKETSIDRTRRLFYVTCSRAQKSLAIVMYTSDSKSCETTILERGWFEKEEIEYICSEPL